MLVRHLFPSRCVRLCRSLLTNLPPLLLFWPCPSPSVQGFIVLTTPGYAISGASVGTGALKALCLLSPLAFNMGASILNAAETPGMNGVHWDNINFRFSDDFDIGLGDVMGMLAVCTVWQALLTWWLDKVVPNEFGTTLKPWFCFTRSYWSPGSRNSESERSRLLSTDGDLEAGGAAREPIPADVQVRPPPFLTYWTPPPLTHWFGCPRPVKKWSFVASQRCSTALTAPSAPSTTCTCRFTQATSPLCCALLAA